MKYINALSWQFLLITAYSCKRSEKKHFKGGIEEVKSVAYENLRKNKCKDTYIRIGAKKRQ